MRDYGVGNCNVCAKQFRRTGVRQRFCAECGAEHRREMSRVAGNAWHAAHRDEANAARRARTDPSVARMKATAWALANPDRVKERNHRVYAQNCEAFKERASKWNKENVDRRKQIANASAKRCRLRNPEHFAELKRQRRKKPGYALHHSISNRIQMSLGPKKGGHSWQVLVGYTLEQLRMHLERQFTDGMSWQNRGHGPGKWHIDHILPVSSFEFATPEDSEFKACWALSNLRPLWSVDNIRKSATRTHLL